jgi:hypothetical protein
VLYLKRLKKSLILIVTILLTLGSATSAAVADVDYSQWNSQATYPKDVINTPYFSAVKFLIDKKILTGYTDGTFKPANTITRAEVAVALTKMMNRTGEVDANAKKNVFTDLSGYDWAKGHINTMSSVGVVKGITATSFQPSKNISYAELITMLIRTKSGAASELDAYGTWPDNYIQYAQMYNLIGDVVIADWNAPATRGDTAKLIYRMTPKPSSK